jgi:hypothetical protein
MLSFNLPELEVSGLALVTAIDYCPPIADGEGLVVTARFVTREVHIVASVEVWVLMALSKPSPGQRSTLSGRSIAKNGCR